ncbi:MAG TPA: oligoendopeptidase F [Candidatus Polarisedimenticolaceae bacterium]
MNDSPGAVAERAARPAETWNLDDIYPSEGAYQTDRDAFAAALGGLESWRGRLNESPAILADALDAITAETRRYYRLQAWAGMRADEDVRQAARQAVRAELDMLGTEFARHTSWLRPELLALPEGTIPGALASEPRLEPYRQFLRNLDRQRPHVLGPSEERIVAEAGLLLGGPGTLHGVLLNAEIPRPEFTSASGETAPLSPANFARWRTSSDRDERKRLFEAYYGSYLPFRETVGATLFECLKGHVFRARVRRYPSAVEAALDGDRVPKSVYTNLIARVREHLPILHRYYAVRARALGVGELAYHDLHCPIVTGSDRRFGVAEAARVVREAMAPLGREYGTALARAFEERWIDWHPSPGKRSGAYANGSAYDAHPYMLLNFNGDFDAVSTLAHEAGHAMHSYFSNRTQPFASADYSIFVAEVASTFNEALLHEAMERRAEGPREKAYLIASWIDQIRATLFRQTFFAEFELVIHERAERGEALTGEALAELYLALFWEHQGHDVGACRVDDLYGIEWAAVPHFYYDFYVYQYATGIVAATSLAADVLSGAPGARDRYLAFLGSGGSDYPLELLRRAGVDLESPEPFTATFRELERRIVELEALVG